MAAVKTRLQKLEDKIEENHKRLREEMKEDLQISSVQIKSSGPKRRCPPDGERRYTPRAEPWFFPPDYGENMKRWDGKSTLALAKWVLELQDRKMQRGSATKKVAAPVARSQTGRYDDDDMSNPLERTSEIYAQ
ncbi:hypothetical protein TURU_090088 [Turdus rufiventris]|nr:hypothetical protein TURU_090088 [Turdus rufiventris]